MSIDKEELFKSGDVVVPLEDEQDIELIPAGTPIRLNRICSNENAWWGRAILYGFSRIVFVYTKNIRHIF